MTAKIEYHTDSTDHDWERESAQRCGHCKEPIGIWLGGDEDTASFYEYVTIETTERQYRDLLLLCKSCAEYMGEYGAAVKRAMHPDVIPRGALLTPAAPRFYPVHLDGHVIAGVTF